MLTIYKIYTKTVLLLSSPPPQHLEFGVQECVASHFPNEKPVARTATTSFRYYLQFILLCNQLKNDDNRLHKDGYVKKILSGKIANNRNTNATNSGLAKELRAVTIA